MFVGNLYLLWRNVYLGLLPIFGLGCLFFLILSCMSCLLILEVNLCQFANIFSHSEACLLVLFMVSFAVQKLLRFMTSHLFIFVFILFLFFYIYTNLFIYLILAALGLCCCTWAFSSCGERGLLLWCAGFSLRWLLLLQSMGSRCAGFSSCDIRAQ